MPFMESEEFFMPEESRKSYTRAKSRNNWAMFLKPFVNYGTVNINLRTKDDGGTLKFLTKTIDERKTSSSRSLRRRLRDVEGMEMTWMKR